MQHYIRVCAEINLDAVAYNFHNMKENLHPDTRIIAVVKTDGYGHGAIPIARRISIYLGICSCDSGRGSVTSYFRDCETDIDIGVCISRCI